MPLIACPACKASNSVTPANGLLFKRVRCAECGVLMEITHENPLTAEWIPESWSFRDWMPKKRSSKESAGAKMDEKTTTIKGNRKRSFSQNEW